MEADFLVPTANGFAFGLGGILIIGFGTRPIVFDRRRGYFWKGRKHPDEVRDKRELKHFAELDDVKCIQVINELVSRQRWSFRSYELNLVLKDGSRLNVVDHGNETSLRSDAASLAEFLGLPLREG